MIGGVVWLQLAPTRLGLIFFGVKSKLAGRVCARLGFGGVVIVSSVAFQKGIIRALVTSYHI